MPARCKVTRVQGPGAGWAGLCTLNRTVAASTAAVAPRMEVAGAEARDAHTVTKREAHVSEFVPTRLMNSNWLFMSSVRPSS